MRNNRDANNSANGSSGGVVSSAPGVRRVVFEARSATMVGDGVEDKREPGFVAFEADFTLTSLTFFHNVWQVKGVIPSILHPIMVCSLLKAISHAGLKQLMKCS